MEMTQVIATLQARAAQLEVQRQQILSAIAALQGEGAAASPAPAPAGPVGGQEVRRPRPSASPAFDDDPAAEALLTALRTLATPVSLPAIERLAKTGLSARPIRTRLEALVAAKLATVSGIASGTRYQAV